MEMPGKPPAPTSFDRVPLKNFQLKWGFVFLLLVAIGYHAMFGFSNDDLRHFILPWLDKIREIGIKKFLAMGDYNYTPTYVYLLYLASILPGPENSILYIKLLSVAGNGVLCLCLYRLFSNFMDGRRALLCAAGIFVLPTAAVNAALWGQCDAFYTAAIVLGIAEGIRSNMIRMMLAIGVAFSFKLQTIFIFPFVIYFILRGRVKVWHLIIPVAVYCISVIPAWMAGKSIKDLALIYYHQAGFYNRLSLGAPNFWTFVQFHLHGFFFDAATPAGSLIALAAGVTLAGWAARKVVGPRALMELAVASLMLIPFLLPRMHDRYFFPADILCYALALAYPGMRTIALAVLMQMGSLCAYFVFLAGGKFRYGAHFGAIFVALALLLVGYRMLKPWSAAEPASSC